jgi:hypothetical protein
LFLTMLGRACPDMPCDVVFATAEWQAVNIVTLRKPPPDTPPSLLQNSNLTRTVTRHAAPKCRVTLR